MATFANTTSPTPFTIFDADTTFQTEADNVVVFVKRSIGDDVLSVELTKKAIWSQLERSALMFGYFVNQYEAKSNLASLLGTATGSLDLAQQRYLRQNLEFLNRMAEPYAMEGGVGGSYNTISGSISLVPLQQDYDIYTDLKDANGTPLFELQATGSRGKMKIKDVFHVSPHAAFRYYGSTSGISYLNNEFSFESFTPETIFYVLPVFEDIMRAGQLDISQRVRRSNYSYEIIGTKIRIHPVPTSPAGNRKLFIRVQLPPNPLTASFADDTIYGVSNLSNVPYGNLTFTNINSIGLQWIREYTLALCKILLGRIRSKMASIPIPGGDLTLDGDSLLTEGQADRERLETDLKEILEALTFANLSRLEADKAAALQEQLRLVPMPAGYNIFMA